MAYRALLASFAICAAPQLSEESSAAHAATSRIQGNAGTLGAVPWGWRSAH
jgi:hypothetical protein